MGEAALQVKLENENQEYFFAHLYPNRWNFSIKIQNSGLWWYIESIPIPLQLQIPFRSFTGPPVP